jgi:hypothetical protein
MEARNITRKNYPPSFNHLRRDHTYRATTHLGTTVGEYLGMESPHGDRSLLLRDCSGTASIPLRDVTSIRPAA